MDISKHPAYVALVNGLELTYIENVYMNEHHKGASYELGYIKAVIKDALGQNRKTPKLAFLSRICRITGAREVDVLNALNLA